MRVAATAATAAAAAAMAAGAGAGIGMTRLSSSSSSSSSSNSGGTPCHYLEEPLWQFTTRPLWQLAWPVGLGVVNFLGVAALQWALNDWGFFPEGPATPLLRWFTRRVLVSYARAFFLLPLLRLALITAANRRIGSRNARRAAMAEQLQKRRVAAKKGGGAFAI